MLVAEPGKRTTDLFVNEADGRLEDRNATGQRPVAAQVPGTPRDGFVEADQAARPARNCPLSGVAQRALMEVYVAGEIEDTLDWCRDRSLQMNTNHP